MVHFVTYVSVPDVIRYLCLGAKDICMYLDVHRWPKKSLDPKFQLDMCDRYPACLGFIVTEDESWCYQYDQETKR